MLAVDTSTLSAFFSGSAGVDVELVEQALHDRQLLIPGVVISEILSAPNLPRELERVVLLVPQVPLLDGVWERCGRMRRKLLLRRRKARLADSLIAQLCIDSKIPFVTRDADFEKYCEFGLRLVGHP